MWNVNRSCQTLIKVKFSRQIFGKSQDIKFDEKSNQWQLSCSTRSDIQTTFLSTRTKTLDISQHRPVDSVLWRQKMRRSGGGGILGNIPADKKDVRAIIQLKKKIKSVLNKGVIYNFFLPWRNSPHPHPSGSSVASRPRPDNERIMDVQKGRSLRLEVGWRARPFCSYL